MDVCVSFYHHLSNQVEGCYEKSFHDFFKEWIHGDVPFGRWTDHVLSYAPHLVNNNMTGTTSNFVNVDDTPKIKQTRKVLLLTYEEMVDNLNLVLQRVVSFLHLDDYIKDEHIQEIEKTFTFEYMKKNLDKFQPKSVTWKNNFKFLRKGEVGDSNKMITNEQLASLCELMEKQKVHNQFQDNKNCYDSVKKILLVNKLHMK